jgi:hypothetical protein
MNFFPIFVIYFIFPLFLACSKDDFKGPYAFCREPIICTNIYMSFHVSISDASGQAIKLDSFEVIDTKNKKNLTIDYTPESLKLMQDLNSYLLFSDAWGREYLGRISNIKFRGVQNSKEIISAEFEVSADCCHVILVNGDTNLVID